MLGIAANYPGDKNIGSDPAVILADDFEAYSSPADLTSKWSGATPLKNMRIATEAANHYSGSKALELRLPISTSETVNNVGLKLPTHQDTIFFRAYTKFDVGFSVKTSGHNGLRISGGVLQTGTAPPKDGTGYFLASVQNNATDKPLPGEAQPGYNQIYAYWPKQRDNYGDHWFSDGWVRPGGQGLWMLHPADYPDFRASPKHQPARGRWYCYEQMVKLNSIGKNDGEVTWWIDGQLDGRITNLFLRSIDTLKIDFVALRLHAIHSERVNKKWYDNVVVAKSYIGPMVPV